MPKRPRSPARRNNPPLIARDLKASIKTGRPITLCPNCQSAFHHVENRPFILTVLHFRIHIPCAWLTCVTCRHAWELNRDVQTPEPS